MPVPQFQEHDQRIALTNELHARPFPEIEAPTQAICLAICPPKDGDRDAERAHLTELLTRHGADLPPEGSNHFYGRLGNVMLKWERHTEFSTYTFFAPGKPDTPFEAPVDVIPSAWAAAIPGRILTASLVHVEILPGATPFNDALLARIHPLFVSESLALSTVLDDNAMVASDFRIDANGFTRFAVFAREGTGKRRLGRLTQRMLELENYKAMAMLTLPIARRVGADVTALDTKLSAVVAGFSEAPQAADDESLSELLAISAEVENLSAQNASRFSAAEAYAAIVDERVAVLREERFAGRQTIGEFMARRFDPAIRTCRSTAGRLASVAGRAARAGDMLRTRTDVARAQQNQAILSRMDERAAQQLRLQETVEGLSVVAVSYYAVNLASYLLYPFGAGLGLERYMVTALLVVPVLLLVWAFIRRIKRGL